MLDAKSLNKALLEIIGKRNLLYKMDYNAKGYDETEDELHELEDDFNDEFEDGLTEALEIVHGKLKSDADILLPTAYIANFYKEEKEVEKDGAKIYSTPKDTGVYIESDDLPTGTDTRILILPSPVRIVFLVNGKLTKELWRLA